MSVLSFCLFILVSALISLHIGSAQVTCFTSKVGTFCLVIAAEVCLRVRRGAPKGGKD